jgi:hypothetical protein
MLSGMDEDINQELKKAIELIRSGKRGDAVPILAEVLHHAPKNANAWFLLGYALDDHQQKTFAFERVLRLDPSHEKAKAQLAKLKGAPSPEPLSEAAPPPPEKVSPFVEEGREIPEKTPPFVEDAEETLDEKATPPQEENKEKSKKRSRRLSPIAVFGGLVLFLAVVAVAFMGSSGLINIPFLAQDPAGGDSGAPTPSSLDSSSQATLPATWTPQPTPTPRPTDLPTDTPLPTNTSTPFPLPPDTLAEIDLIQKQVAVLRDLPLAENVTDEIMPQLKLRLLVYDLILTEDYLAGLPDEGRILAALGFIAPGYDITEPKANDIVDYIGGFYVPEDNKINVLGTGFYGIEKYIYAHEYTHALQDQHFDLTSLGTYPECVKPEQTCLAIRALVEGEADYVQNLWLANFPPEFELNDILRFNPSPRLFQEDVEPPPPYFGLESMFPYVMGFIFVDYLYQRGGWEAINQTYSNLPVTTEQILHPEKYVAGEVGTIVNDPLLSDALGPEWRLLKQEVLGEWESFLLLAYSSEPNAQLSDDVALAAAEGWEGDSYQVYYNDETAQSLLTAHWTWETTTDANEFYSALRDSLSGRFMYAAVDGPGNGDCWFYEGRFSCVYKSSRDVLWLYAPELAILEQLKAEFPRFP